MRFAPLVLLACHSGFVPSDQLAANAVVFAQPQTHEDDDALVSLALGCTGAPLPAARVADLFASGVGVFSLGAPARTADAVPYSPVYRTRVCDGTACGDWSAPTLAAPVYLFFYFDAKQRLWLQEYDRAHKLLTSAPIDGSDTLLSLVVDARPRRFRIALRESGVCIATLVREERDYSHRFAYAFNAPREQPQALPVPERPCNEPAAQPQELRAWFSPDSTMRDLRLLRHDGARFIRQCHALTGCTLWQRSDFISLQALRLDGDALSVDLRDPWSDARVTQQLPTEGVVVGKNCAAHTAHLTQPGDYTASKEVLAYDSVVRE